MKQYKKVSHIHVGQNGGESLYIHDINGDGEKELIFRQSPGMLDSPHYPSHMGAEIGQENKDLFQLTCLTQKGELLWRYGSPWPHERPYNSHSGTNMTKLVDPCGGGDPVWLNIVKDEILIIDAKTGVLKEKTKVSTASFNIAAIQKMKGGKFNILLKCDGSSEYGYGKPLMCYDSSLNLLWEQTNLSGGGHNIVVKDIDGDGCDEIFEGYNLLDHDGSVIWSHDFPSHSDQTTVCDIDGDGIEEVIYCTDNEDFIIADVNGNHRQTNSDFLHPQKISVGRFMEGQKGFQMFMNNRATHGGAVMLDCYGNMLWDFPCNGYAQTMPRSEGQELDLIVFMPGPGRCPPPLQKELAERAAALGYKDLPIEEGKGFEPFVIDGCGKIIYRFEDIGPTVDVSKWGIGPRQKNDFGAGFSMVIDDIDGDGKQEFIFHTRTDVYIFHEE